MPAPSYGTLHLPGPAPDNEAQQLEPVFDSLWRTFPWVENGLVAPTSGSGRELTDASSAAAAGSPEAAAAEEPSEAEPPMSTQAAMNLLEAPARDAWEAAYGVIKRATGETINWPVIFETKLKKISKQFRSKAVQQVFMRFCKRADHVVAERQAMIDRFLDVPDGHVSTTDAPVQGPGTDVPLSVVAAANPPSGPLLASDGAAHGHGSTSALQSPGWGSDEPIRLPTRRSPSARADSPSPREGSSSSPAQVQVASHTRTDPATNINSAPSRSAVTDTASVSTPGSTTDAISVVGRASAAPLAQPTALAQPQPSDPVTQSTTMSRAARNAVLGKSTAPMKTWQYCGLYRWNDAGTDERALTPDEVLEETRKAKKKVCKKKAKDAGAELPKRAIRYQHLRERWSCLRCGSVRHEMVGATSNLTRHSKACPAAAPVG